MQKALTTDAISKVCSALKHPAMAVPSKRFYSLQVHEWDVAPCPQQWFRGVFQRRYLQKEISQAYVRARAITCPIFQSFVYLCEIVSASCQPSCTSKHSYMHNHASYMLMLLIKLLCCSYTFAFSIPMLISVKINHVNFKPLLSCQFQTSTIMSISNLYYNVNVKLLSSR